MAKSRYRMARVLVPLFLFLFGCFTPQPPAGPLPEQSSIAILGESYRLAPGSDASFLVQVRNPYEGHPLPNQRVEVFLNTPAAGQSERVFAGDTGGDGIVQVSFAVPKDVAVADQVLEIRAETDNGESTVIQDVYVGRVYNVLVSTDKPVYQPGQVIHLRGLALDALDLHAADTLTMTLTVADPQGNKLMRQELATSQYGIASADFPLDGQAPSGDYIVSASMGPATSTRSVEVKPYTLPRFEVKFQPDKTFYLPGEVATGKVDAHYFFGKPVAGASVTIRGATNDVGDVTLFELTGKTDENGVYAYAVEIPAYFVGQLDNKSADVDLTIEVIDTANHSEQVDDTLTVAEKALLIDAVPESGVLRPGIENIVYLDVSYPDGAAATATLTVTDALSQTFTVNTDAYGLATITLTASSDSLAPLEVVAVDAAGNAVTQPLLLGSATDSTSSVLLRPDKAEYRIGDMLSLDIFVNGQAQTAYLDIIKDRQTFGLVALPVKNGMAQAALPIDGSLLGTLELNAYIVDDDGMIVRDQRLVLVNPAPADITVRADAAVYKPGDTATLDIQVKRDGQPMPGAVGIAIVDESVFAVEAQDPGFARTYFLLERNLLEPRFEIHDFAPINDDAYSPYDDAPDSVKYGSGVQPMAAGGAQDALLAAGAARQVALHGLFAKELAHQATATTHQPATRPSPLAPLAIFWGNRLYLLAPLVGIALYDGSRKRRKMLIALVLFSLGAFFWAACAGAAAPASAPAAPAAESLAASGATTATQGQPPPRLRQFFPETLYWMPELETDDQGRVQVDVPIADSITTWRVSVLASDRDGNLGSTTMGLRVFQDFFVEPDLPRFLTVGDEVDAPITLFNYLDQPQTVTLEVAPGDWFEIVGQPQLTFAIGANEVAATYLPIRVTQFGSHELQITATGAQMSDAVVRAVEVLPDGKQTLTVDNGRLAPEQTFTVGVPPAAVPGTGRVTVKIYPGIISQVVAGLDGLLHEPYGCFEQTSSATYPNVLILDYLKTTGQANPRIQVQADYLINLGYQRLLTFEVPGEPGGFSLFGDPPAQTMLTAYGIMEFTDMSQVAYVDPALLTRVAEYLFAQQNSDGSWDPSGMTIESGLEDMNGRMAATAYIVWGLADAGYGDDRSVRNAVRFLERQVKNTLNANNDAATPANDNVAKTANEAPISAYPAPAENQQMSQSPDMLDNYTLALTANALAAAGQDATPVLARLLSRTTQDGDQVSWDAGMLTYMGSYGDAAAIETTAIVAQALLRTDYAPAVAEQALNYLVAHRDPAGSFYTTQATIQALKALIRAAEAAGEGGAATVTITLQRANGETSTETLSVDDSNGDVVQQVSFDGITSSDDQLTIAVDGERSLQYQVVTEHYMPWEKSTPQDQAADPLRVRVAYDRTELSVNDMVNVRATAELLAPGTAGTVIVDLGIPPGFAPVTADLDALVDAGTIDRYELTGRQIILYLTNVQSGQVYTFDYRLQARFPVRAQTPSSQAYDYYAPDQNDTEPPQRIIVTLGTPDN